MNANLKYFTLTMGLIGLLTVPAGAGSNSGGGAAVRPPSDHGRLLLAGGSSLLATGNQKPSAKAVSQSPAPKIISVDPLFDFGRVLEGTEVVHDFLVENHGAGDLAIDQVRTG